MIQPTLDFLEILQASVRIKETLLRRLGGQIHRHENAHGFDQVAVDRILLHAAPLRPRSLRGIPEEGRLDRC